MQKKIIALAVAGLVSGVAYAQTNVTVYGVIDQAYVYSQSKTGLPGGDKYKFSGLADGGLSGSRFGFFGEEALGNGLKAIFRMEYGREQDENGGQTLNIRQSYVGLSDRWGTVTAGRHYNAASDIYGPNSSNGVINVMPLNMLQGQGGAKIRSQGGNARQDNLLKYTSPNWSGFTLGTSYAFGENKNVNSAGSFDPKAKVTDNGTFTLAGNYNNGPFNISAAYAITNSVRTGKAVAPDQEGSAIKEWYLGGNYDFQVVKLYATYQQLKNDNDAQFSKLGGSDLLLTKSKLWSAGVSVPTGARGKVMVEYAKIRYYTDNQPLGSKEQDGYSHGWGIGYQYDLSKRTSLYAFASQIKHDEDAYTVGGFPANAASGQGVGTAAPGEKQSNFIMGVRHMF